MKASVNICFLIVFFSFFLISCKRETVLSKNDISQDVLQKIIAQRFSTENVRKVSNGYLVEGDIILTEENLNSHSTSPTLLIAQTEQYSTKHIIKHLPRTITVSVTNLPDTYLAAADNMIARYNALGLQLTFERVSSGGMIDILGFDQAPSGGSVTLGTSGFPTPNGDPFNQIQINTNPSAYGSNPNLDYMTSILQPETGHCIGFRHTDYFDRALSCGGSPLNETEGKIGAELIPGTPSGFDAESFMLACLNSNNRTFNANDKIALNYLYSY